MKAGTLLLLPTEEEGTSDEDASLLPEEEIEMIDGEDEQRDADAEQDGTEDQVLRFMCIVWC